MKPTTLFLPLLASLALVACGGDDDDPVPTTAANTSEDSTAQSMLLTIQDFPTGWAEVPSDDDDEDSPFQEECELAERAEGITGRAETGDFEDANDATVTQLATVFESAENVQPAMDSLAEYFDCLVDVVNDGKLNSDGIEFGDAKRGTISLPAIGEKTTGTRITFTGTQEDSPISVDVYMDVIGVQEGRYLSLLTAIDVFSPFDTEMLVSLAEKAEAKFPAGQ